MTRSHKFKATEESVPRYFAKAGPTDSNPNKTKKNGGGRGNWGREGDEVEDYTYNSYNARRRSNSSSHAVHLANFKTKFEMVEPEPVFEARIHGPNAPNYRRGSLASTSDAETDTKSSASTIAEEDADEKKL